MTNLSVYKLYLIIWGVTLLVLFVALPFGLMALGFSRIVSLSFVIGVTSLLSDGFLTKLGLNLGCSETNIVFRFVKGKINTTSMIIASRVIGILIMGTLLTLFNDAFLLLMFAMCFISCVIANAITLAFNPVNRKNHRSGYNTQDQHSTTKQNLME